MGALHELWQRYRDDVTFMLVYIAEMHPTDGWETIDNRSEGIAIAQPTTLAERVEAAASCVINLAIEMPVVIDDIDNGIAAAYGALPDRLYLVGTGGIISYQGEMGPGGLDPSSLEAAIKAALA